MVRIRVCEESLVGPILTGEIRTPCHLYSGQEAVAAGICTSLNKDDCIFGNHRSHGHFLAKGGDMKRWWLTFSVAENLNFLLKENHVASG